MNNTIPKVEFELQAFPFSDYASKVPEDVRKANEEKLEGNEAEVVRLAEAVQALKVMDS